MACFHLPVDFEMREDVRKLVLLLKGAAAHAEAERAPLFFVRLWTDWARAATEWRPLEGAWKEEAAVDWSREMLARSLEEYCRWEREDGDLIKHCLHVGMLRLERRGDLLGLTLREFWRYNEHLSPGYRSIQARGGLAKAAATAIKDIEKAAGQQAQLLQPDLHFPSDAKPSPEETTRAVQLIMRIYRACGLRLPATSEYSSELTGRALGVVRGFNGDAVAIVERYLHASRDNPEVVKQPARVIERFEEYFKAAQ